MDIDMKAVGKRIKERREEIGVPQDALLEESGITAKTWKALEAGEDVPSVIVFYRLSEALHCNMEYLLTGNRQFVTKQEKLQNIEKLVRFVRKNTDKYDSKELASMAEVEEAVVCKTAKLIKKYAGEREIAYILLDEFFL